MLSYSSKWVGGIWFDGTHGLCLSLHLLLSCYHSCWQADTYSVRYKLPTFFFMKLEGSLQRRCPHNGGCILPQNISKFLADYMVSHPNVSNLHSHCHMNLKSVSLPHLQLSLLLLHTTMKNCSTFVKLLGSKSQDGVPGIECHYSWQQK